MRLALVDGEMASTGLSTSQILAGDPRLAVMVLAASIDYNLHQTQARRENIEYVEGLFRLFTQATEAASDDGRTTARRWAQAASLARR